MRLGFAAMLCVRVSALGKVNSYIMLRNKITSVEAIPPEFNRRSKERTILALKNNNMGQTNSTADGSTEQQWDIDSTPVELVLQVCGAADLRPH